MATPTLQYPDEILGVLGKEPDELEVEGRLLLALKYYENGQLSSGLAAQNWRGYRVPSLHTSLGSTVYRPSEKHLKTWKSLSLTHEKSLEGLTQLKPFVVGLRGILA